MKQRECIYETLEKLVVCRKCAGRLGTTQNPTALYMDNSLPSEIYNRFSVVRLSQKHFILDRVYIESSSMYHIKNINYENIFHYVSNGSHFISYFRNVAKYT